MKRAFPIERSLRRAATIAIVVFAATGCDTKTYQIDLQPKGDKIERRLTISRHERNLADQERSELGRIARLYGAPAPRLPAKSASFSGTYSHDLPNDLGGNGHFVHWDSPLGRVCVYVERFRGNDDVHASLEVRRKAVDELVDLLVGWFESELHGLPDWPALRNFLDKAFRGDVQNLSLFAWTVKIRDVSESKSLAADLGFRAAQYFVERGYFTYEEAPTLFRVLTGLLQRGDSAPLLPKVRQLLVARAGTAADGRLTDALGFLSDSRHASASWHRYFSQTASFKQHKDKVKRQDRDTQQERAKSKPASTKSNREPATPGPMASARKTIERQDIERQDEVLFDLSRVAFPLLDIHLFGETNQLELSIAVPREPFWTNGKWVAADRRVVWSKWIPTLADQGDPQWPRICCAAWDEPDEEAQTRLLGLARVIGDNLFEYCLWYQSLSGQEKQEWDAFLPTATKEKRFFKRLDDFRFSNEPATDSGSERVAFPGANDIKNALEAHKP